MGWRWYNGFVNKRSMNDVLKPIFVANVDFVTAGNCFGSPANTMLDAIPFDTVLNPK